MLENFDFTTIIVMVLTFVLGSAVAFSLSKFAGWFQQTRKGEMGFVVEWAVEAACELAEQLYVGKGRGAEKLADALKFVEAECLRVGVKFDAVQVTALINKYVAEVINKVKEETAD